MEEKHMARRRIPMKTWRATFLIANLSTRIKERTALSRHLLDEEKVSDV